MEKKMISVELELLYLDGPIDEIIKYLLESKERYKSYPNLVIRWESVPYEDYNLYYLYGDRLETDEEVKYREERETKMMADQIEWEKRQLETLLKKYPQ